MWTRVGAMVMAIIGMTILQSCNSSKRASKSNFRRALVERYQRSPEYIIVHAGAYSEIAESPVMNSLVKIGMAVVQERIRGKSFWGRPTDEYKIVYKLTGDAPRDLIDYDGRSLKIKLAVLDADSIEVITYTEPTSQFGGAIASYVDFSYEWKPTVILTDPKYADFRKLISARDVLVLERMQEIGKPQKETTGLVLYNDGWKP